ncbi:hypothetical protein BKD09_16570 [Bradyrhizobium japonicum]|uniref:DUF4365 domain-containing protein n=1 Tax=Bradyrhizobium japonicum TaxID=375 RepID=A0A1L3F9F2_BRAJP|nr:DUF4365 domain-containing protein [Bradyrhizobium japonicum]APG09940.1 hypothetical protein BKD09_16570 [Bradyrhizobium japonicum]
MRSWCQALAAARFSAFVIAREDIGHIGEQQFQLLCVQAGLICNKSSVDVMGWDFMVEFPAEHFRDGAALDQRQAKAVRVQLKSTVGRTSSRVRLSLSSLDRLAKDAHPSIIVVFRISQEGKLQSGYLVHLPFVQFAAVVVVIFSKLLKIIRFRAG